jgi:hypothetical protein
MALLLKFEVEGFGGRIKALRLPKLSMVQDAINELRYATYYEPNVKLYKYLSSFVGCTFIGARREKLASEGITIGGDYGVYFPGTHTIQPRYLDPSKTIEAFDFLDNGVREMGEIFTFYLSD